jgi:uncharacterized membrane protein YdbT with pleckstrin-like domain
MNPDEVAPTKDPYDQPVAYDAEGRPLYAHPPIQPVVATPPQPTPTTLTQPAAQQVVHIARAVDPIKQEVSDETKKKHDRSMRLYPSLNLSENEYVISAVRRHPIGLIIPLLVGVLLITIALTILSNYAAIVELLNIQGQLAEPSSLAIPLLLFCVIIGLGMFVAYYVYVNNKFFLTNESVIQEIQISLFSRHEQTVSLGNIEDASFSQQGILQQIINYGSIRLSTEGDETTYRFSYVANPKDHIATLNNAVEAFKNGRPVED